MTLIRFFVCLFLCFLAYLFWLFGGKVRKRSKLEPSKRLVLVNGLVSKPKDYREEWQK